MVMHKIDMIGKRFNRLTVIAYAADYVSPKGKHWTNCLCRCDCGKVHTATRCSAAATAASATTGRRSGQSSRGCRLRASIADGLRAGQIP